MAQEYDTIAKEIIENSIRSVIYVDDGVTMPFEKDPKAHELSLATDIFQSFYSHNCGLDFYKYSEDEKWEDKSDYFFKGRDLFIIDWELNKTFPEHKPTLSILSEAVKKESLHFICIYTTTESTKFPEITYKLNAHFSPFKYETVKTNLDKIVAIIEGAGFDSKKVLDSKVLGFLKEMVLYKPDAGSKFQEIRSLIISRTSKEMFGEINSILAESFKNTMYGFCAIGFLLNEEVLGPNPETEFEIHNFVDKKFLTINHTIILIANKQEIQPKALYEKFSEAIIDSSSNFLTLMGLEMRNFFKESSAFIGKDIDSINQLAFFHHQNNANPKESFFDFLKELWKNQAASFLNNADRQPKIFNSLDDYKAKRNIDKELEVFSSDSKINEQPLGKLNYYYNILHSKRIKNDHLGFGDIFRLFTTDESPTNDYLLCVTAICDCLYPTAKIKDHFYFVRGSKTSLSRALQEGDRAFSSYIQSERKEIIAVEWEHKPFTIYIPHVSNNIDKQISTQIGSDNFILRFHSSLKENYAQRIANNGFVYPLHVGIYFASTPEVKK